MSTSESIFHSSDRTEQTWKQDTHCMFPWSGWPTRSTCCFIHEWNRNRRRVNKNDVVFGTVHVKKMQGQIDIQTHTRLPVPFTACRFYCLQGITSSTFSVIHASSSHSGFHRSTLQQFRLQSTTAFKQQISENSWRVHFFKPFYV
jgi:hypothetical protein